MTKGQKQVVIDSKAMRCPFCKETFAQRIGGDEIATYDFPDHDECTETIEYYCLDCDKHWDITYEIKFDATITDVCEI